MINLKQDIIYPIKRAYQRVTKGYDYTIKWSFDWYLDFIFEPLKEFCEYEISEDPQGQYNPERIEVFKETLRLINKCYDEDGNIDHGFGDESDYGNFWEYFGAHIGFYWD